MYTCLVLTNKLYCIVLCQDMQGHSFAECLSYRRRLFFDCPWISVICHDSSQLGTTTG